jgi:hypothetical protein
VSVGRWSYGRKTRSVVAGDGELVHVETPLGIVNVYTGLRDRHGRRVDAVEMIPNSDVAGPPVRVYDNRFVELLRRRS